MTYLLGLKQPGLNAIIADCRMTILENDVAAHGENTMLKTGILFPGCIFGISGNVACSQEFIVSFKQRFERVEDSPRGFFQRLKRFVDQYNFRSGEDNHFRLLLSERRTGFPEFAFLDSQTGLSNRYAPIHEWLFTVGSGKEILDPVMNDRFIPRLNQTQEYLLREVKLLPGQVMALAPYFLCLWLCEMSLTFERDWLHNYHVGGVFHFLWQTGHGELPQQPALYIFSVLDRTDHKIYSWFYVVANVAGAVYVLRSIPPGQDRKHPDGIIEQEAYLAPSSRPDHVPVNTDSIKAELASELASVDQFAFCGFGFTPPSDRSAFYALISPSWGDIFDNTGRFTPRVHAIINNHFKGLT